MVTPTTSWEAEVVSRLGTGGGGGGGSDGATAANQVTANQTLDDIKSAIAPTVKPSAVLQIATVDGTIPAGAKFASFTIPSSSAGSIQGTTLTSNIEVVEFPMMPGGYDAIAYTITSGSFIITYAI